MTVQAWHADSTLVGAYVNGSADPAHAASLEAHLLTCGECRQEVARRSDGGRMEVIWHATVAELDAPSPRAVERLLVRAGVRDHVARLLAATPSLRISWLLAVTFVLTFAAAAGHVGAGGVVFFLAVAPLAPLAGVAVAYGRGVDPTYEVGLAAPMRGFDLLLVRAVGVLAASIAVAALAALALPRLDWTTVAWLLPALALASTSLALSSSVAPVWAFGGVAAAWIALVALTEGAAMVPLWLFRGPAQAVFAGVTVFAVVVLVRRHEAFDEGRFA